MENESITVTATMTLHDFLAFQWHHAGRMTILMILDFSFVTASLIRSGREIGWLFSLLLLLVVTGVIGGLFFLLFWRHFVGLYKSNKLIQQEQTFIIKKNELEIYTKTAAAKYAWQDLYAAAESKDYFYIYIAKEQSYLLPKSNVTEDGQIAFIRHCLLNLPDYKGKAPFLIKACKIVFAICLILVAFVYVFSTFA
jgi:hypothetical protein